MKKETRRLIERLVGAAGLVTVVWSFISLIKQESWMTILFFVPIAGFGLLVSAVLLLEGEDSDYSWPDYGDEYEGNNL